MADDEDQDEVEETAAASSGTARMVQVVRRDPTAEGDAAHYERQIVKRAWQLP